MEGDFNIIFIYVLVSNELSADIAFLFIFTRYSNKSFDISARCIWSSSEKCDNID